jgi:lipopolysaccharide biosynthesis glycosyltransferase
MARSFKYLYVFVSGERDLYYEQLLVSATSLRYHNPEACIVLLIDDATAKTLSGFRESIKAIIDSIVVIDFPAETSPVMRSRSLKTRMRNLINGDFLYIDCDTIIAGPLSIASLPISQIGAVLDMHTTLQNSFHGKWVQDNLRQLHFSYPTDGKYFNSGVMLVRDTDTTRIFFARWNELWQQGVKQNRFQDQFSLCQTNHDFDNLITEISGIYNCQIEMWGIRYFYESEILHFQATYKNTENTPSIHPLMGKAFYRNIKKCQILGKGDLKILLDAKKYLNPNTQVVPPDIAEFIHSHLFHVMFYVRKFPSLFRAFNFVCSKIEVFRNLFRSAQ